MKFTPAGKAVFQNHLTANHFDLVYIGLEDRGEQGTVLSVRMMKNEEAKDMRVIDIDGLRIAISEQDDNDLADALFDAGEHDGEFVIEFPHSHGCGCSCHEDGCGCDDDCECHHDHHDDDCCCHQH